MKMQQDAATRSTTATRRAANCARGTSVEGTKNPRKLRRRQFGVTHRQEKRTRVRAKRALKELAAQAQELNMGY